MGTDTLERSLRGTTVLRGRSSKTNSLLSNDEDDEDDDDDEDEDELPSSEDMTIPEVVRGFVAELKDCLAGIEKRGPRGPKEREQVAMKLRQVRIINNKNYPLQNLEHGLIKGCDKKEGKSIMATRQT